MSQRRPSGLSTIYDLDNAAAMKQPNPSQGLVFANFQYQVDCSSMDNGDSEDDRKPAAIDPNESVSSANSTSNAGSVKPALKKEVKPRSNSKDKHLKWDEQVIEEHDLLRGTRMKIDEPNTPYTYYDSGAESDDSRRSKSPANQKQLISWDNLQTRLDSVAAVREQFPQSPSSHAETDQSDAEGAALTTADPKSEMRSLEFKEHRKRHYNEMELVRQFRQQHPDALEVPDTENEADVEDGNISD